MGKPLFSLFVLYFIFCGCCSNKAPAEHFSPDGKWKYVSFDRNCGATTRDNLQISILRASESLSNKSGNTFIADDNHGAARFVAQAEWVSPMELKITYSAKARIFKKESKVQIIAIKYVEEP
jgi:ABC-type uncharacterized transport system auxiliary subunit